MKKKFLFFSIKIYFNNINSMMFNYRLNDLIELNAI